MRFLRDMQNALYTGIPLHRGPVGGTWRGLVCRDFWEKRKVYLGSFLGPRGHQDFKSWCQLKL